jgi:hypothetical protein
MSHLLFVFPSSRREIVDTFLDWFPFLCLRDGLVFRMHTGGTTDS